MYAPWRAAEHPLIHAAMLGHTEVVDVLLRVANIDVNIKDPDGLTALHWSVHQDRREVVGLLLAVENIDVNALDFCRGSSALHFAVEVGDPDVVDILLQAKHIDVNVSTQFCGNTPLWLAVNFSKTIIAKILSAKNVDVSKANDLGKAPLHRAVEQRWKESISLLLAHKHINVNSKDTAGFTPLHEAAQLQSGNGNVVRYVALQCGHQRERKKQ